MATRHLGEFGRWALWFSPLVVVPGAYFASKLWENDWVFAVFAVYFLSYSAFVAARLNRRQDEVQIAGQRFAVTKAMTIGTVAGVLVMAFPPSMNALVDLANTLANTFDAGPPVRVGIGIGFMLLALLQLVSMFAVAMWWGVRTYGGSA